MFDPEIKVWNNVTYADNYYQTRQDYKNALFSGKAPYGQKLEGADWNVDLSDLASFDEQSTIGDTPHTKVLNWYVGTGDLSIQSAEELTKGYLTENLASGQKSIKDNETNKIIYKDSSLFRRYGDLYNVGFKDYYVDAAGGAWYAPDHTLTSTSYNNNQRQINTNAVWEGIGTGWFYSVLGGGIDRRPYQFNDEKVPKTQLGQSYFDGQRTPVTTDNTNVKSFAGTLVRGDYAVPTLFDGDFDSISNAGFFGALTAIPGWSGLNQNQLKTWSAAGATNDLAAGYPNSYALELDPGQSITHNSFVVSDWGALRFDLFVPKINGVSQLGKGGKVEIILEALDGTKLEPNGQVPKIELTEAGGSASDYAADRYKIGYGETGFETFTIDVPDSWRGKVATLRFESSGATVYLDNVFFKSQNLLLGNPSDARKPDQVGTATARQSYDTNYLLEKPQYAVSYNDQTKTPNWVSWQLNQSWLGEEPRPNTSAFKPDQSLPTNWDRITYDSYLYSGYDRGHMTASSDRNRNQKDILSTYLMTNILPQHPDNNSDNFNSAWYKFEKYLQNEVVTIEGKEVYVIAGGWGLVNPPDITSPYDPTVTIPNPLKDQSVGISVPAATWKVALILNPGEGLQDVTTSTRTIAIITPNDERPGNLGVDVPSVKETWRDWTSWVVSVDEVEALTGLNFFSNLPDEIQNFIEARTFPKYSSPLLADASLTENSLNLMSFVPIGFNNNLPIGHDSILEESSISFGVIPVSSLQVGFSKLNLFHTANSQVSSAQIGSTEVSVSQITSPHNRVTEVSTSEVGTTEINPTQLLTTQINSTEIYPTEISLPSSITLQQLLSSHNYSLQNTTVPTWLEFLQGTAPFNLNIQVTDLPTGQLAEANITGFDPTGRPNAGTLYLDTDANGLGWFIDPTPWDNTEYSQILTDTAYRATADSAAYSHYDLLTTILHETSHLQGIIAGYSNYDSHIQ